MLLEKSTFKLIIITCLSQHLGTETPMEAWMGEARRLERPMETTPMETPMEAWMGEARRQKRPKAKRGQLDGMASGI